MAAFEPKNPDYRTAATALIDGQPAMRTLGISIVHLAPGEVELAMLHSPAFTQQNGFVHAGIITAGLDNACGVAAFTLMPREVDILTVEFKTTLLAPARGERFVFTAEVIKPGRTLTFCEAKAFAEHNGLTTLIATMSGTLMAMLPRVAASQVLSTAHAQRDD
ncbi:PaaI family thioesterase [Bradyrhizobium sp. 186]|uniref:PaaI family thioesterase n=1 Tax=Bradyrhizobium sp. 186 TaxID=2782654 RepID=UPI002001749B|nr:PaaI family thioesterase [Bradyrhizobium sp. 186]UPK35044.1 PaaI family thioesterase [Bradyrhizobium sp. 186]